MTSYTAKDIGKLAQKIFLSAVTGQFGDCRIALRSDLAAVGAEVKVQEDFQQHGGTLMQKLEAYIDSCDRVIVLVGSAFGSEPELTAIPANAAARSYSQWEYYFAMGERLNGTHTTAKPIYVYFATPAYLEQYPVKLSPDQAQRQKQFIDEIRTSGKDRNKFDSIDQLGRLVLRDGFKLSNPNRFLLHNLPYDSLGSLFIGREDFMAEVRANLSADSDKMTAIVTKQTIHGLGGVGKTRVAVEYAWRCLADYSACLFVNADSAVNLARNVAELCSARVLNLPERVVLEEEQQAAAALRWLNEYSGWLLILDNVDTPEAAKAVRSLLPSLQNGHVLITSRLTDWDNSIRTLALDTLSEDDAAAFLLANTIDRRTPSDDDADIALSLAQTMDGLALALEQAGAFINKKRLALSTYQQRWIEKEAKLRHWHDELTMTYPRSLAVTWESSFELLTPAAQALLNLLSCFGPDPIPRETFEAAFSADTLAPLMADIEPDDKVVAELPNLEDLLDELESLSLMKWQTDNRSFSIHRLVQDITQSRLGEEHRKPSFRVAVGLIIGALPSDPPPNDVRAWPVWDPLRPHIDQLIQGADAAGITDPTSRLMNDLGQYLQAKSLLREAEPLMRRALAIDEASFGTEHPDVATKLNNLALLFQDTNRLAEAEPLMRRALAIDEASFGTEHPNVATKLNNLALLFQDTNRLAEAEPLMRRALAIDEASFGTEHPNVATKLNNLALLFQDTNRLAEAEPLMRRALAIDEASFGTEHPNVAIDLNNLAQLFKATNRLAEAEPLMRRALAIDEASFGTEHPNVARDLNNLASLLLATNRLEEAEPLMRRALAIDEASFGTEHTSVAIRLTNLASLLQATNRLAEAEPLMRRALAIDETSFGTEHTRVAAQLNNLAQLLQATNRLVEAEPLMRRALAIDEASFGTEHPRVATQLNNLALLLQATNRLEEAEPLMRQMVEILLVFTSRTGHEHPNLNVAFGNYQGLLAAMGRDDKEQQVATDSLIEAVKHRVGS